MALTDNLLAYWNLDEVTGTRYDSISSLQITETGGSVGSTDGISVRSLQITDGNVAWLTLPAGVCNIGSGRKSFSIWFKINANNVGYQWIGPMQGNGDDYAEPIVVYLESNNTLSSLFTTNGSNWTNEMRTSIVPTANEWHHVVVTYSGTKAKLYYDGQLVATSPYTLPIASSGNQYTLGHYNPFPDFGAFSGQIDELGIWSRVLTFDEVYNLYYNRLGNVYPFSKPVLIGKTLYFNDQVGAVANDGDIGNILNWWTNEACTLSSTLLPIVLDDIVTIGHPSQGTLTVNSALINNGWEASTLTCTAGITAYGYLTNGPFIASTFIHNNGTIEGTGINASNITLNNTFLTAYINGNTTFTGTSFFSEGTVNGDADFYYPASSNQPFTYNSATVTGKITFHGDYPLDTFILSYWKMDEYSGTRLDATGNNYNLTEVGENSVGFDDGIINAAAFFYPYDASYLEYYDYGLDEAIPINKSNFSFACWFNPFSFADDNTIAGQWDGSYEYSWILRFNADGLLEVIVNTGNFVFHYISANINLNLYNWYHCAFTYDGTYLKLYINSQLVGVTTIGGSLADTIPQPIVIGSHELGNFYFGLIDELGIWNRVLSQEDIFNLYYRRDGNSYPFSKPVIKQTLNDELLAYYPLDENTGTRYDHANGYDLTQNGVVGSEKGIIDNAASFTGIANNTLSNGDPFTTGIGWSYSFWVNVRSDFSDHPENPIFLSMGSLNIGGYGYGQLTFFIPVGSNVITIGHYDAYINGYLPGSYTTTYGTWNHVAVTNNPLSGISLYVNGNFIATTNDQGVDRSWQGINLDGFNSGAYQFNGLLDDVKVWNRSLDTNEIKSIYRSGAKTSKYTFQKVLGIPTYTFEKVTPQSILDLPFYIKSGSGAGSSKIKLYQDGLYGKRYIGYYPEDAGVDSGVDAFRTLTRSTDTDSIHGDEESTVNFDTFTSSDRNDYDHYSWQWTGYFKAPYTDEFVFTATNIDDAVNFWIGDNAISGFTFENKTTGGVFNVTTTSDPIPMIGGQYYPVRLQFGENDGGDQFILEYSSSYETNVTNFQGRFFHLTHQDLPVSNPPVKNGSSPYNAGDSAYQIKTDFPSLTTATLYWIKNANINDGNAFQIYADMTTLGGGWTLILNNHSSSSGWTFANAISANVLNPPSDPTSVTNKYSIVAWADYIKKSSVNFQYMIDAQSRGYNGGIYTALSAYSFTEQYAGQPKGDALQNTNGWRKNISEAVRFPMLSSENQVESLSGIWNYNADSIEFRMPYYTNKEIGQTYLTTNGSDGGWWGSLISDGWSPVAPWIGNYSQSMYNVAANPTAIWYWVR